MQRLNDDTLKWTKVNSSLPKSGEKVHIAYYKENGKLKTTIGFYADKYSIVATGEEQYWEEDYNEEEDEFYIIKGWYDQSEESKIKFKINNVTHWMPLLKHPFNL